MTSDELFFNAMRENVSFHLRKNTAYQELLTDLGFEMKRLNSYENLHLIPPLPTSYLKKHSILTKPYQKLFIKTTSSGTTGQPTLSGFDFSSAINAFKMVIKAFRYHHLLSLRRTNYVVLGYQPSKANQSATAKAFKSVLRLAPKRKVTWGLVYENNAYKVRINELVDDLKKFVEQGKPIRIIGMPVFIKELIDLLDEPLKLPAYSKILVGGGWKSFLGHAIPKHEFNQLIINQLGINADDFKDHFSCAEHPINYLSCRNGNFHVPVFSRVIIRDVKTLAPLAFDEVGILNFLSPLLTSAPFGSILTDDLAILKEGKTCGCGIETPYFVLLGRVGMSDLKVCAQVASEFLKGVQS
jgi:hypothetical protein